MVRIGPVWDSTTQVLSGRPGPLAQLAFVALFLPPVIQRGVVLALTPGSPAAQLSGVALGLVVAVATVWGLLSIVALATDPATAKHDAQVQAVERLLPAIGVGLVIGVAFVLLMIPPVAGLAVSGFDWHRIAMAHGDPSLMPRITMSTSMGWFLFLYTLALAALFLWASARLFLINAVILNERRGLGAIGRSIQLTRGSTWRLIGLLLLVGLVAWVAQFAVVSVIGIAARLTLGAEHNDLALYIASIGGSVVGTAFAVVVHVFIARFYVLAREGEQAHG